MKLENMNHINIVYKSHVHWIFRQLVRISIEWFDITIEKYKGPPTDRRASPMKQKGKPVKCFTKDHDGVVVH